MSSKAIIVVFYGGFIEILRLRVRRRGWSRCQYLAHDHSFSRQLPVATSRRTILLPESMDRDISCIGESLTMSIQPPQWTPSQIRTMGDGKFLEFISEGSWKAVKKMGRELAKSNKALDCAEVRKERNRVHTASTPASNTQNVSDRCLERNPPFTSTRDIDFPWATFPQRCLFCGFRPGIPRWAQMLLCRFLKGDDTLLQIFASAGVEHDVDLFLLFRLPPATRIQFLNTHWSSQLSPLQKIEVEALLEGADLTAIVGSHSDAGNGINIMAALGIENLEDYTRLMGQVFSQFRYTLDLHKSFHEQDTERINLLFDEVTIRLVTNVRQEFPIFKMFPDDWPLRCLATQFLDSISQAVSTAHYFVKVLKHLTTSLGAVLTRNLMGELVSVFNVLGLTSSDQLHKNGMAGNNLAKVQELVKRMHTRQFQLPIHLTPFHFFLINDVLERGVGYIRWTTQYHMFDSNDLAAIQQFQCFVLLCLNQKFLSRFQTTRRQPSVSVTVSPDPKLLQKLKVFGTVSFRAAGTTAAAHLQLQIVCNRQAAA
ncbi:hypothetical protein C8R43DRAFT_944872 [Mycena crocata]|nr:hypothetical protein C8R43DRAFT_944872 [Mycena crocata]